MSLYIVDEFWIVKFNGIPLFSYSPNKELDSSLISSFFSAIQKFSYEINKGKDRFINSLSLGDSVFNFLVNNEYNLYFISKSSDKIKSKVINRHLKEIEEIFLDDYNEDIKNFIGELTRFNAFESTFRDYFQDKFVKLKSMW